MEYISPEKIKYFKESSQIVEKENFSLVELQIVPQYGNIHVTAVIASKNPEKDFLDKAEVTDFKDIPIEIKDLNTNKTVNTNFLHLNSFANYEFKFINKNAPYSKKLLLISDSYGFSFTPFAVELFEEVIFTTRYGNYFERSMNLINQEKPDLVIYLSGERFFANY